MNIPDLSKVARRGREEGTPGSQQPVSQAERTRVKVSRLSAATAVACAVAVASLGFAGVSNASSQQRLNEATADMTTVVVTSVGVPAGGVITADMLSTVLVPGAYVSAGAVSDPEGVVGHTALVSIEANSQVRGDELSGDCNGRTLAGRLESGQKAVSINVTAETDFARSLLHQGDRVSLYYWEVPTDSKGNPDASAEKVKHRIAADVEVVALDGYVSYADLSSDGITSSYSTVTVAVSSGMAQKIRRLQDDGVTIWMVLTASADVEVDAGGSVESSE